MALRNINTGEYLVYEYTNLSDGFFIIRSYENADHRDNGDMTYHQSEQKQVDFLPEDYKTFLDNYPYCEDRNFRLNMITAAYDFMMTQLERVGGHNVEDLEDVLDNNQVPSLFRGI